LRLTIHLSYGGQLMVQEGANQIPTRTNSSSTT
jgi:hypothetical protein